MVVIIEWWDSPVTTLYYEIKFTTLYILFTVLYYIHTYTIIIIICNNIVYCTVLYIIIIIIIIIKFYSFIPKLFS